MGAGSSLDHGTLHVHWRSTARWFLVGAAPLGVVGLFASNVAVVAVAVALVLVPVVERTMVARSLAGPVLVASLPADGVVGRPVALELGVAGVGRPAQVRPFHPWPLAPRRADSEARGHVELVPLGRGMVYAVGADVEVLGPLGLVEGRRAVRTWLPLPTAVAPNPDDAPLRWPPPKGLLDGFDALTPRGDTLPRGVRAYRRGDARRRVHWKATARHGRLMVCETEGEAARRVLVVLELTSGGPTAEAAVARAARAVLEALAEGWQVRLRAAVHHLDDPARSVPVDAWRSGQIAPLDWVPRPEVVEVSVHAPAQIGRVLAAAVAAPVPTEPASAVEVARIVTEDGDRWA